MATATNTVESLEALEEGYGMIEQGVPDPQSLHGLMQLLRSKLRIRSSIHKSEIVEAPQQTSAEVAGNVEGTAPNLQTGAETTERATFNTSGVATRSTSLSSNPEILPEVQSRDNRAIGGHTITAGPSKPIVIIRNLTENGEDDDLSHEINGDDGIVPSPPALPIVQRLPDAESQDMIDQSHQHMHQDSHVPLPPFKFIGTQKGKISIWRKVQALIHISGENVYLATGLSPSADYVRQWEETWDPTLREAIHNLIIDQNDIFTFDLRMVGASADVGSMKPTILVICHESYKSTIEKRLRTLVKQTVPKEVRFQVVGRRPRTASPSGPSGKQIKDLDTDSLTLSVEYCNTNYPLETMMGSAARIFCPVNYQRLGPGHALSTIGGLISVGNSLYALTTAHTIFTNVSSEYHLSSKYEPFGKVDHYKWAGEMKQYEAETWSGHISVSSIQSLDIPMDWALISIHDELIFPNYFLIDKTHFLGGQVVGFAKIREFAAEEDVWICSPSGTQSGILSSTSVSFVLSSKTFKVHTVMLEHCLVDGDSGSWVVSHRTHKLCGYIFARVEGLELGYMLPIEPVFDNISAKMSEGIKLEVDVPDGATIRRLGEMREEKLKESGEVPEHPPRPAPVPPPNSTKEIAGNRSDDSLEALTPKVEASSIVLSPLQSMGIPVNSSNVPGDSRKFNNALSSVYDQFASPIQQEDPGKTVGTPGQKSPEMEQISGPFHQAAASQVYSSNTVATCDEILEAPFRDRNLHGEAGQSSSFGLNNSQQIGAGQVPHQSLNPHRELMMTKEPTYSQLSRGSHKGLPNWIPPPSRQPPERPRMEPTSNPVQLAGNELQPPTISVTKPRRITLGSRLVILAFEIKMVWRDRLSWIPLEVVFVLPLWFLFIGFLTYFVVRKSHFSNGAKVGSIIGAALLLPAFWGIIHYHYLDVKRRQRLLAS